MNILIAPDSFKGTFRSRKMAEMIKAALPAYLQKQAVMQPLADGGEGTAELIANHLKAKFYDVEVIGPYHKTHTARYYISGDTAIMDMASASGLECVSTKRLKPALATTYGTGQMMLAALNRNVKKLLLGLGGSATIDGGAGALMALGAKLLDQYGSQISLGNRGLSNLHIIDIASAWKRLQEIDFTLLSDVTNPLLGDNGAVRKYGPQKGVLQNDLQCYETNVSNFAGSVSNEKTKDLMNKPGAGAAGGMGFGLATIGGKLVSGFDFISDLVGLDQKIKESDLIITGEGKVTETSFQGKVIGEIIRKSSAFNKRCLVISGGKIDLEVINKCNDNLLYISLFEHSYEFNFIVKNTFNRLTKKLNEIL